MVLTFADFHFMQNVPSPRDIFMMFVSTRAHVSNISLRMFVDMGSSSQHFDVIPITSADTSVCIINANLDSSGNEF